MGGVVRSWHLLEVGCCRVEEDPLGANDWVVSAASDQAATRAGVLVEGALCRLRIVVADLAPAGLGGAALLLGFEPAPL